MSTSLQADFSVHNSSTMVLTPDEVARRLQSEDVVLIDLARPEIFAQAHIQDAIPLNYQHLVRGQPPAPGLLPPLDDLVNILGVCGIDSNKFVIACDDEGGGKSSRLVWTLNYLGHTRAAVLDGGIHGWLKYQLPVTQRPTPTSSQTRFTAQVNDDVLATIDIVLSSLDDPTIQILDARTPAEFHGSDVRSARGGHIPGAINLNWMDCIDANDAFRFLPKQRLEVLLSERNLDKSRPTITYCQSHHRSSHSYVMLKWLGFTQVQGYAGSWSEWGNRTDTPVEV